MSRILCLMSIVSLFAVMVGCGSAEYSGPQRIPLEGQVTFDGEPVDVGSISFIPLDDQTGLRVSGGFIADGSYAVPEAQGANAGKYRIEVRWQKATGKMIRSPQSEEMEEERKEGIPPQYNTDSELTVEVSAQQKTYDFDLK